MQFEYCYKRAGVIDVDVVTSARRVQFLFASKEKIRQIGEEEFSDVPVKFLFYYSIPSF